MVGRERINIILDDTSESASTKHAGCPVLDDIVSFTNLFRKEWETEIMKLSSSDSIKPLPNDFELTTLSPGADRKVVGLDEIKRFREMPMRVKFRSTNQTTNNHKDDNNKSKIDIDAETSSSMVDEVL